MISDRIKAIRNIQCSSETVIRLVEFNLEWVVNKVSFTFRFERQECITYVRTWGQLSRESAEKAQRHQCREKEFFRKEGQYGQSMVGGSEREQI